MTHLLQISHAIIELDLLSRCEQLPSLSFTCLCALLTHYIYDIYQFCLKIFFLHAQLECTRTIIKYAKSRSSKYVRKSSLPGIYFFYEMPLKIKRTKSIGPRNMRSQYIFLFCNPAKLMLLPDVCRLFSNFINFLSFQSVSEEFALLCLF